MPSIKEQDRVSISERMCLFVIGILSLNVVLFFAFAYKDAVRNHWSIIHVTFWFMLLGFFGVWFLCCSCCNKYNYNIKVLCVKKATCPMCKQCTQFEIYSDKKNKPTAALTTDENSQVVREKTTERLKFKVHCMSCGYKRDVEFVSEMLLGSDLELAQSDLTTLLRNRNSASDETV